MKPHLIFYTRANVASDWLKIRNLLVKNHWESWIYLHWMVLYKIFGSVADRHKINHVIVTLIQRFQFLTFFEFHCFVHFKIVTRFFVNDIIFSILNPEVLRSYCFSKAILSEQNNSNIKKKSFLTNWAGSRISWP